MARRSAHQAIKGFDITLNVTEDYDYCYRLSRVGKFRMIKSNPLLFSSRRLQKEGKSVVWKWLFMAVFTLFNIPFRKKNVKYEYGKY